LLSGGRADQCWPAGAEHWWRIFLTTLWSFWSQRA
jgi:hypothetical protein